MTAAAGCKGGHIYSSVFNAGTFSNCTFDQGSQTITSGAGAGGICASEAHYTDAGSSACYLEKYTTAAVTASTCVHSRVEPSTARGLVRKLPTYASEMQICCELGSGCQWCPWPLQGFDNLRHGLQFHGKQLTERYWFGSVCGGVTDAERGQQHLH